MRYYRETFRLPGFAGVALFALALAACSSALPYQARSSDPMAFGYTQTKLDATHYSVVYVDNSEDQAQSFLELRAAQLAQTDGFPFFVFDKRGTDTIKQTDNDLQAKEVNNGRGGVSSNVNDYIPNSVPTRVTMHFYALGEIHLLTADEAKGNSNAIQASDVLAKMSSKILP